MVNKTFINTRLMRFIVGIGAVALLQACQTDWVDPGEGAAVKAAIRAQSVYPDGRPDVPTFGGGRDGVTARSSIEAYQRSFLLPAGGAAGGAPASSAPTPTPTQ